MTDVSPPTPDQRWFRCKNADSVSLDGYGLVKVNGANVVRSRMVFDVKRPLASDGYSQLVATLGPTSVAVGKYGWCTFDWPAWVLYDTADAPASGQLWGPETNSLRLKKGQVGFLALGGGVGPPDRVLVDHQPNYHNAGWIRFKLPSGGMATTDQYVDGCTVLDWWAGFDPGSTTRVYNFPLNVDFLFEGVESAVGLAFYDPLEGRYYTVQMECPADA
jgi:hypothetical protein